MKHMKHFLVPVIMLFMATSAFGGYHQLGVEASAADNSQFVNSQGGATQIYVTNFQGFTGGGAHYFWPAMELKKSGTSETIFMQLGYYLGCAGCTPYPFVYTERSGIPGSNIWKVYTNYPLQSNLYHTFWFETNGVANPDGTYNWEFWFAPNGTNDTKLETVKFESTNSSKAPYLFSEVAGSSNACGDSFSVQYGWGQNPNYALLVKKLPGGWYYVNHANARYFFDACNSNVSPITWQEHITRLPATRTVCDGCQVW